MWIKQRTGQPWANWHAVTNVLYIWIYLDVHSLPWWKLSLKHDLFEGLTGCVLWQLAVTENIMPLSWLQLKSILSYGFWAATWTRQRQTELTTCSQCEFITYQGIVSIHARVPCMLPDDVLSLPMPQWPFGQHVNAWAPQSLAWNAKSTWNSGTKQQWHLCFIKKSGLMSLGNDWGWLVKWRHNACMVGYGKCVVT